jgi:dienelactone hydrolase
MMRVLMLLLALASPAIAAPDRSPQGFRVEWADIPFHDPMGVLHLKGAVMWPERPAGKTPPVVVLSHGSPLTAAERPHITPLAYLHVAQWFLDRGYVVVAGVRRGFGASEGAFVEGVNREPADFASGGRAAGKDIRAVLDFVATLRGVDHDRVVLVGHSAGGFGSLAAAADGAKVRAVVNFSGGKGAQLLPLGALFVDRLVAAAGDYGHSVRVPSLWIYAQNDSLFVPAVVQRMFAAYRAGGAPAEMESLPAVGADGHAPFSAEAMRLWGPKLEAFLERIGAPGN